MRADDVVITVYSACEAADFSHGRKIADPDGKSWYIDPSSAFKVQREMIGHTNLVKHDDGTFSIICMMRRNAAPIFGEWIDARVGEHVAISVEAHEQMFVLKVIAPIGGHGINIGHYKHQGLAETVLEDLSPTEGVVHISKG